MKCSWLAGGLALVGSIGLACTPQPPPKPDLLLVTFDTTRADAIGAWGATPSPSPTLDGLAAEGLRFDEAMATAPLTLPSHTSMLSGLYPDRHQVRDNGQPLPETLASIAEPLRDGGWSTGAFVAAVVLDGGLGLDRGFDRYHDGFDVSRIEGVHDAGGTRTADQVADRAIAWLDVQSREEPVFLWVHVYDPHHPLTPPPEFARRFDDPYAAEIAFADHHVGRVVQALRSRERAHLIVAAGDHGEGRGDHGETTHGQFVYRSTMHVPLVVAGTGVAPGVVRTPVSVADVAPTLAEAAGVVLDGVDGRSLLAEPLGDRVVYGESYHQRNALGLAALHVWQDDAHRYIDAPRPELYAWRSDPGEATDLAGHTSRSDGWAARVSTWRAERPEPLQRASSAPDPTTAQALAALGYLSGAPPEADAVLPDPKDHPDLQERVDALVVLARTRPPTEAVPLLRTFVADHPRVQAARQLLVRALQLSGDPDGALEVLGVMLAAAPDDVGLLAQAAELELGAGRLPEARALLERASAIGRDQPGLAALRGEIARRQGRCAEVLPDLDASLRSVPEASRVRVVRGACRRELGQLEGAADDLARVLADDPENPDVRYLLGMTRLALGQPADALPLLQAQLQRTPDAALAHGAVGLALLQLDRTRDALDPLRRAAADPIAGPDPALALAEALLAIDADDDEIAAAIDLARSRAPADPRALRVRAAHLMHLGRSEEALEVMVQARRLQEAALNARPRVKGDDPWNTEAADPSATVRP